MNTTEVTVTVSHPYRVIGFRGDGSYGPSNYKRRTYTADVNGTKFVNECKSTIQSNIRVFLYRTTGSNRARFTFVSE